jgi:hypothetical protein
MRGNGLIRHSGKTVQKELLHSNRFLVTSGLGADYQSRYGVLLSPRLSAATQWRGFVFRSGGGIFVHNLANNVFMTAIRNDGSHLQQFMLNDASFAADPPQVFSGRLIRSRLDPGLTRPRALMFKSSAERAFGKLTSGFEYTWTRDLHLLGSRCLPDGDGWLDVIESNRSSIRHQLHARMSYRWRGQAVTAHYEWTRSRDNTDGPFSFPGQEDSLRAEWARSAGIAPHNISLAANFSLPGAFFLTLAETWRGSAPYNITTGFDPAGNGLYTDRGGLARNTGNGPAYGSLSLYGSKRLAIPEFLARSRKRLYVNLGIQGTTS